MIFLVSTKEDMLRDKNLAWRFVFQNEGEDPELPLDDPDDAALVGEDDESEEDEEDDDDIDSDWEREG